MLSVASATALALAGRGARRGVIINEHVLSAEQTRLHVATLARRFDFIAHDELPARLERPGRRPFCLMTFDDGKRSNATETAPELERLGVPAVFYVTSRFLSEGAPLWFDRYAALRRKLARLPAGLEPAVVKQLPFDLLSERLDRACRESGAEPDLESDQIRPMSWDQARELARRGFTVGAHGLNHANVTRESRARALLDIEESIRQVGEELGSPCVTYAFPNGNYTAELARHALHCGVRTVMTTEPTWVHPHHAFWRLPRIQLFGGVTSARIELKLAAAATGALLANPDGTGRLYRLADREARQNPT